MNRKALTTASFFLLLAGICLAAPPSVKLPAEAKGLPGAWIVIPAEVEGGKPRWRFPDAGLEEVRLDVLFPSDVLDKAKGKVVKADKPGRYRIESWNAAGDVASDIAVCVVVVGDAPPKPEPPGPEPQPPEPPGPSGVRHLLLIRETADATPDVARMVVSLRTGKHAEYLASKSHKLHILDDDSADAKAWQPFYSDLTLPALLIIEPTSKRLLRREALPKGSTADTVMTALRNAGG